MGTVHQFPVPRNPPATAPAQELARALRLAIDVQVGADAPFAEREVAALALTNEATRLFLQSDLLAIADRHGAQVEVDGVIYQRHEPGTVRYFTLCGALDLERWTYREIGVRNGPTIVPLELAAGLVEHTSPALGVRIALGYAKDHMRSAEEDMQADHRCPPSRSTLERVAKVIGTEATRVAPRIAPRLRRAERVPERPASPRACGGRGAGAGRRRRHRDGARPHGGPHGGGRPGRRAARDAPQDTDNALHPQETSPGERQLPHGLRRDHQLPRRRWGGTSHAPLRRGRPRVPDGPNRDALDGRSAHRAAAGVPTLAVGVLQDGAPELWNLLDQPSRPNR